MTTLLIIIFVTLIGIMGCLMFKKNSPSTGGIAKPPIEELENYEIPQKKDRLTFTEFSEDEAESPPRKLLKIFLSGINLASFIF